MVDNYNATLRALLAFLVANAPEGAERDVARLQYHLDSTEEAPNYIHLEWRRPNATATLYIEIGKFGGKKSVDEEGNTWHEYELTAQVSWPSYGSDDVVTCQARLALMTEIVRLAAEVQRAFAGPIHHLSMTKAEKEERDRHFAEVQAKNRIATLILNNIKGLSVGQQRRIEADGPDFGLVGEVTVNAANGRKYTTHVTATRAFYFMRVA